MRRLDLPEIEDQGWCPPWLRSAMTGYLQEAIRLSRPYGAAAGPIAAILVEGGGDRIVDLCSGAGGPWPDLKDSIEGEASREIAVVLTDLHPNPGVAGGTDHEEGVRYFRGPVSALSVPDELAGVRTMFTALHHFPPDEVEAILGAAQRDRVGFAAFEATHRSWKGLLTTLLIPLMVLVLIPRVRPLRWQALLFTYLIPVVPLATWWDGFASTLRTYRAPEIDGLLRRIADDGYRWSVEEREVEGLPVPLLQVIGRPVRAPGASG